MRFWEILGDFGTDIVTKRAIFLNVNGMVETVVKVRFCEIWRDSVRFYEISVRFGMIL